MKGVALVLIGLSLVGCGQAGSSSGVEDASEGPSNAQGEAIVQPQATVVPKSHRWPTASIGLNTGESWAIRAGSMWANSGVTFRYGATNGITFKGFSTARNSLGWAQYKYRNGMIYQCDIYINPRYLQRYDIIKTFAHELGHCLGIDGHLNTGGLMSKYGGNDVISQYTTNLIRSKYGYRKPRQRTKSGPSVRPGSGNTPTPKAGSARPARSDR